MTRTTKGAAPAMTVLQIGKHLFALPLATAATIAEALASAEQVESEYSRDGTVWVERLASDWDYASKITLTLFDGAVMPRAEWEESQKVQED